ncbi:MAG: outer membrane lipoprotein-sorting protein [Myxococcota bacterium]
MLPAHRLRSWIAAASVLLSSGVALASSGIGPGELADRHFRALFGFSALEAYEVESGPVRASFAIARRYTERETELLIDILSPLELRRSAALLRSRPGEGDELIVYWPTLRRAIRVPAGPLEEQPIFEVFPLHELRPTTAAELEWTEAERETIRGVRCRVVRGVPRRRGVWYDRLELAISPDLPFALEARYSRGGRMRSRVTIDPREIRDFEGRSLPSHRRIERADDGHRVDLWLRRVVEGATLPHRLFTRHNLRVQHFPRF